MVDILPIVLFVSIWIINYAISVFNAIGVGRAYRDPEFMKGWMKVILWSSAIMSVCGFTWCYLILVGVVANMIGYINEATLSMALQLGYIILILPILGSGCVLWVQSIITAAKARRFGNYAIAGWNTFAMITNFYSAFRNIPQILRNIGGAINTRDSRAIGFLIAVILIVLSLGAGIITTYCLAKWAKHYRC